ncbi:hypothetical protein [Rubrivirga sp.]|uniref:hypothetical protein n=1 Tax=Rubrivirga sp. TaxID=1885344 RepID=UPI003C77A3F2
MNPGPNSKLPAEKTGPGIIPAPPASTGTVDLDSLTADEIRARLDARQRDLKYHIEALRHEATTIADDVNVNGRPLMDYIRERPLTIVTVAAGVGALVGSLFGIRARRKRVAARPEDDIDFIRARLAHVLEDAAERVAEGEDPETSIRGSMETMPVIYGDSSTAPKTPREQAFEVALTTAVGFLVKKGADMMVQRLTPHDSAIDALTDDED